MVIEWDLTIKHTVLMVIQYSMSLWGLTIEHRKFMVIEETTVGLFCDIPTRVGSH